VSAGIRQIDEQRTLTQHQKTVILLAGINGTLEFFDQFIIAFVLAFVIKPWQLTYGQSAVILLSSGIGSIAGSFLWGSIADRFGRRIALVASTVAFSLSSLLLAATPEGNWAYFVAFRAGVGLGVGGYIVNIALVQEFTPAEKRGWASGVISISSPTGVLLSSACAAFLTPLLGWRGMFVVGALPAFFAIAILAFIPESPRWALKAGRVDLVCKSTAWVLEMPPESVELDSLAGHPRLQRNLRIFSPTGEVW
jgi:putative MFS transporter